MNLSDPQIPAAGEQPTAANRSVLCIQPNARNHPSLHIGLRDYRIVIVPNALEAIRAMNAGAFDAYVVDYWLPDWTGVSLCRDIRKNDASAPICFFASAAGDEQRMRAMRAGADSYVHVSRGAEALADDVRKFLRRADLRSLAARIEAERAIQEEVQKRAAAAVEASELLRA